MLLPCVLEWETEIKPLTDNTLSCRGKLLKRPVEANGAKSPWTVNASKKYSFLCCTIICTWRCQGRQTYCATELYRKPSKRQPSCQLPFAQIHMRHVPTAPVERDRSLNMCERIIHAILNWMYGKKNLARLRTSACCCTCCQDNSATKWACKYQHLLSIPSFLGASFVYSRKSITVPNTKVASFPFILGTSTFLQTDKFVSWHCSKYS